MKLTVEFKPIVMRVKLPKDYGIGMKLSELEKDLNRRVAQALRNRKRSPHIKRVVFGG